MCQNAFQVSRGGDDLDFGLAGKFRDRVNRRLGGNIEYAFLRLGWRAGDKSDCGHAARRRDCESVQGKIAPLPNLLAPGLLALVGALPPPARDDCLGVWSRPFVVWV